MFRVSFGSPEKFVPSRFCDGFNYIEEKVSYDIQRISFNSTDCGCTVEMPIDSDEQIYGFGLQLQGFNHTGRKLRLQVNSDPVMYTGDSHAPVPFFVTNKGYGMYFDTARTIEVYCGFKKKTKPRKISGNTDVIDNFENLYLNREKSCSGVISVNIMGAKGIDIYIIEGKNITEIVSKYNILSGGGCEAPLWGLGATYRVYTRSCEKDVLQVADYFKRNDIKIDTIGLEPGWQTTAYSCSYIWNEERFPNYKKMIHDLKEQGFHVNLWEHGFVNSASPIYNDLFDHSADYEVWNGLIPDFSIEDAQKIFADYHQKNLVDIGIDGFKLDECDGSDFVSSDWSFPNNAKFPGGMTGEQYHHLFGTLYMKTVLRALGQNKTLSSVRNAGALAASYPFVLYSDLYNHKEFIRGTVNAGFSGLLWTPEVRDAKDKKDFIRRLQSNVFSIQCLINAWYMEKAPWLEYGCEEEVKQLLNIRESLKPILKRAFDQYKTDGKPPIRALVSDYTDDSETYNIDDEYIFCDDFIVAPLTAESDCRKVYLPAGEWCDYWTGERVSCGWFEVETEQIPVFKKIG